MNRINLETAVGLASAALLLFCTSAWGAPEHDQATPPAARSATAGKVPTAPSRAATRAGKAGAAVTSAASADDDEALVLLLSRHHENLLQALRAKDFPMAREHLHAMQARLPASSVMRLRVEGWYAQCSGDKAMAQTAYRALLEIIPGDPESSINLATVEISNDQPGLARQVLSEALYVHPDSVALHRALNQLGRP